MATTFTGKQPRELNEETIEAVRRRIGIPVRFSPRQHNESPSADSFRHFARAYGDDNPLYTDPDHATSSSWGAPIAPPLYAFTAGVMSRLEPTESERAILAEGDPLAGIGQYMCGERWILTKPIRAGDAVSMSQTLFSADLRDSSFGGGTGALVSHRVAWEDERGQPFAYRFLDFWHADREKSQRAGKNKSIERTTYSEEEIARYDRLYETESRRGRDQLYVADVSIGDKLGPIAKGPLSVTDMVNWHAGVGWGMYGGGSSRLAYENRKRVPKFYVQNQYGFWDSAQRCHWDDDWARRIGHPAPYDYGVMRSNWMVHLVTNWMGDDAWIWKMNASIRKFNYLGDAHVLAGEVRDVDRSNNTVTIDVWGDNQRGERTCDGRIVVILPTEQGGHASIPEFDPADVPEAEAP